jgi:adenylate kinase family enzyme
MNDSMKRSSAERIGDRRSPQGILLFGANGSGKTTLGREVSRRLGFYNMDMEDYCFEESEIPYAKPRPREEYVNLMLADIEKHGAFVLTAVTGDLGDSIPTYYALAVYLSAPFELRMERVKQRSLNQYGARILPGGDMYEQEQKFFDFVATRPLSEIDRWAETLTCPVLRLDGTEDLRANAAKIAAYYATC